MRFAQVAALLGALLVIGSGAQAAGDRNFEGAVSSLNAAQGQIVVCSTRSPFNCSMIHLGNATRVVWSSTGKPAHLAVGSYVSVEAVAGLAGPLATDIKIYADRFVRTVDHFAKLPPHRVENVLGKIKGVKAVNVIDPLGEVLVTFNTAVTTEAAIEKNASHKGIHLVAAD